MASFLFWSTSRTESQIIQESKTFWIFFVDYSIIDAKLSFVWLNHCYLMHSKRGEPSLGGWSDKQNLGNVPATLQYLYFDQQSEKTLQAF